MYICMCVQEAFIWLGVSIDLHESFVQLSHLLFQGLGLVRNETKLGDVAGVVSPWVEIAKFSCKQKALG